MKIAISCTFFNNSECTYLCVPLYLTLMFKIKISNSFITFNYVLATWIIRNYHFLCPLTVTNFVAGSSSDSVRPYIRHVCINHNKPFDASDFSQHIRFSRKSQQYRCLEYISLVITRLQWIVHKIALLKNILIC